MSDKDKIISAEVSTDAAKDLMRQLDDAWESFSATFQEVTTKLDAFLSMVELEVKERNEDTEKDG